LEHSFGALPVDFATDEWEFFRRNLLHLLFKCLEVFRCERMIDPEVVVKAVLDRRSEADLSVGTDAADGCSQEVRGRVPEHGQCFGIALREYLERAARTQGGHQILDLAVDLNGNRGAEQPLTN
jgi:hypothetical protein